MGRSSFEIKIKMGNIGAFKRQLFPVTTYLETSHSCPQKITNGGQHYIPYGFSSDNMEVDTYSQNKNARRNGYYKTKTNQLMTYSTFEIIGEGSFGIVYSARNQNNDLLAVKYKKRLRDSELMQKSTLLFRGELEALFNLEHQNIVKLLGVEFYNNEVLSLIMDHIVGDTLDNFITNARYLKEPLIKSFTRQLVDAIAYMHSKFVMHRDIKSSNIMIVDKKIVKLIDFGMAKLLYVNPESYQMYPTNTCVGTAPYMAPEVKNFQGYDSKADIFSIGALIYEMATGDVFVHNDGFLNKTVMLAQLNSSIRVHTLSQVGNEFLQQCLIKDANQRPSARALVQHPFIFGNNNFSRFNTLSKRFKNPFLLSRQQQQQQV